MTSIIENNLYEYVDPTVEYIQLEQIENHMNDIDPKRLAKYLDLEFLNAQPDSLTKDTNQIELEFKENISNIDLDIDDRLEQKLLAERFEAAVLVPREYQFELFQKALVENVIAVLDTGAGKTLISIMLLKQMVLAERQARLSRRETKLAFFLVERVPLVFQQANVIKANCDARIEQMCGEMNVDTWSAKKWKQIFEDNDVCVMTAQIFLDCLHHGFISLEKAHLIIFDECHHTTKKHPFNLIMREFYDRCQVAKRPKIFGMTASPTHKRSSVQESVTQLEKNLDARVYTAKQLEELYINSQRPKEISLGYFPPPEYPDTPLMKRIHSQIGSIEKYKRCFTTTKEILSTLGPWCCDQIWIAVLNDLEEKISRKTQGFDRKALQTKDLVLKETHDLLKHFQSPENPDVSDRSMFTSKVEKLITVLRLSINNPGFCGIVFVRRRHTALALLILIQSLHDLKNARCDILIGHGTTEEGDIQMTFKDQNKIIEKFKTGELNLLIATSVAEEGLDIQPCNIVIRFDFFHTLIAYIQSRGRARRENSKYVLLIEDGNEKQFEILKEFRALENSMKNFCQTLPDERNVANKFSVSWDDDMDIDDDDSDFMENAVHVPETGALLTKQNAIALLYRYCGSLPSDDFCVLKPVFEIEPFENLFKCKLTLPINAPFQYLESPSVTSKYRAKALAALEACARLRQLNALDENLLPKNYRKEILGDMKPQFDENGYIIGSRRRQGYYEKKTPSFWSRIDEMDESIAVEDNPDLLKAQVAYGINHSINSKPVEMDKMYENIPIKILNNSIINQDDETYKIQADCKQSLAKVSLDQVNDNIELGDGPFLCWFTIIKVQLTNELFERLPYRQLCLITKKPFPTLPELKLFHNTNPFMTRLQNLDIEVLLDRQKILSLSDYMLKLTSALINKEFHCHVLDIPYYIVPFVKNCKELDFKTLSSTQLIDLIDWKEIDNTIESVNQPFILKDAEFDPLDSIIIDCTDNMRRYFVDKIRDDMNATSIVPENTKNREYGYSTFLDYYKENKLVDDTTDLNQPMLQVKRLKKQMNFLYPHETAQAQIKGALETWTLPSFCKRYFISSSVYQAAMMIPSIMTRIDSLLLMRQAREKFDLCIKDKEMLEAYTTPSASMEMNYERMETLGDSFLKFIATIRLYINFPFSNEGELHHLRIRVICNRALYRSAKRLKFYRYITSHPFNRRYWRPPGFSSPTDNSETLKSLNYHCLSDKTLADIVEASLGAAYLSYGCEGGLYTAIQLQIPFDNIKTWEDFNTTFEESRKAIPARAEEAALQKLDLVKITEILGRSFEKPLLIVEALTHASLPNSGSPCYQRLEFLGDAILDFLVIRYLYRKYPNADPGIITDLKGSCVNNNVLGIICMEIGLHNHIIHYSGKLLIDINQFIGEIEELKNNGEAVGEYWPGLKIPKVLSDVVESMLGATFVDAGFRLEACEALFEKWFMPIFDKHVTPELIQIHPMSKLFTGLQRFGCDAFMLRNHCTEDNGPESQKCVIFLHDKPLACGSDWNIKIARRNAAIKAIERLEDEPGLLESVCNCRISMTKRGLFEEQEKEYESE